MIQESRKSVAHRFLITAGNTHVDIDQVRVLTNRFTGKTGARLTKEGLTRGHHVTLLTSHPDLVADLMSTHSSLLTIHTFRTFQDLERIMFELCNDGLANQFDCIAHAAAVSDYLLDRVEADGVATTASKIKSSAESLVIRLKKAPKLIDHYRATFGYKGCLVKFKLEAGILVSQLLDVAEKSRLQSGADFIAANLFETYLEKIYFGPNFEEWQRQDFPALFWDKIETYLGQKKKD